MEKLIELVDVYKIYNPGENEVRALDGIDLTIHKGEYAAIIGASGSGKSTMMNSLLYLPCFLLDTSCGMTADKCYTDNKQ